MPDPSETPKTLLEQIRNFRSEFPAHMARVRPDKTPREATLLAVPRKFALQLIQEYAADTGKPISEPHQAALQDCKDQQDVLLVIDGLPVLCGPMAFDGVGGYTWPPRGVLADVEESIRYPGIPWYKKAEVSPEDMFRLCRDALRQALEIVTSRPTSHFAPLFLKP